MRISDPNQAVETLSKLWKEHRYIVFLYSLVYLYPTLTKGFCAKMNWNTNEFWGFFATSVVVVGLIAAFGMMIKHIVIFIPAAIVLFFLFVSFVTYLISSGSE